MRGRDFLLYQNKSLKLLLHLQTKKVIINKNYSQFPFSFPPFGG